MLLSVDMEARTQQAQTPLHYAAKSGAAGCVRLLVAAGAELSSRDYRDRTPLQLAAVMGTALTLPASNATWC